MWSASKPYAALPKDDLIKEILATDPPHPFKKMDRKQFTCTYSILALEPYKFPTQAEVNAMAEEEETRTKLSGGRKRGHNEDDSEDSDSQESEGDDLVGAQGGSHSSDSNNSGNNSVNSGSGRNNDGKLGAPREGKNKGKEKERDEGNHWDDDRIRKFKFAELEQSLHLPSTYCWYAGQDMLHVCNKKDNIEWFRYSTGGILQDGILNLIPFDIQNNDELVFTRPTGKCPLVMIPEENAFYTGFKLQGQPIGYAFNQRLKWEWFLLDIPGHDRSVLLDGPCGSNPHRLVDPLTLEIEFLDSDAQMLSDATDEPEFVDSRWFSMHTCQHFQDPTSLEIFVETHSDCKWETHDDREYIIREGLLGSIPNIVMGRRLRYIQASEYSEDQDSTSKDVLVNRSIVGQDWKFKWKGRDVTWTLVIGDRLETWSDDLSGELLWQRMWGTTNVTMNLDTGEIAFLHGHGYGHSSRFYISPGFI
ncbi:hypothetical protein E1B28_003677 [Marasmius oreades]|uniref:Uncharacterized protein n=1 Tax=Marasmius oreades TaxID=181124 RepID=A0A9P8AB27_9AGAR|nr:uncharacterized protein E1B28_003677 [Marasmius oreades]KAG7096224.1 hypothetical protein E1B28_003677 [Marasmius oreades]